MQMDNKLRSIVNLQKNVLSELENEVKNIENSDLTKENAHLKAELQELNSEYLKSTQNVKTLSEQNAGLKNALHEQIYNEKVKIVNSSKDKLEIYFKSSFENEVNRLTKLENSIASRINNMTAILQRNNIDIADEIYKKLDELSTYVNRKITEAQKRFAENHGAFSQNEHAEFETLKNEQITDEQMLAVTKKNNIERFVGLNLLNVIGIFLIIIGVITAARYTYFQLPATLKGAIMFALGMAMLIAGEIMNRKKPNIFSLGITAGGVGVLYVAIATSYFALRILDKPAALVLFVLITATAFFLSTRYNSQTILTFALVGGYLPIFFIKTDMIGIYGTMVYFIILNLLALIVSFKKKWDISSFIGLFLNIAGTIYICCTKFDQNSDLSNKIIVILYIMFAFLTYTLIPIISTYKNGLKFRKRDVVLLAINTFFSSLIMYAMFYLFKWQDFTGTLAIIFAVIYILFGRLIESKFKGENNTQALFYLTGLTFVVLIIPFQFGRMWLTLGWLAEGVALASYGILKNEKNFKHAGFVINALCLWAFLVFDLPSAHRLFAYKYLAITIGSLIILGAYMYKGTLSSGYQKFYKYAAIVNLWCYAVYISFKLNVLIEPMKYSHNMAYLDTALAITLTFIIAYAAPRVKILSDSGVKSISMILYIIGILWLLVMNSSSFIDGDVPAHVEVIAAGILVLVSLFSVFALRDLMKFIVMERELGVEWYPLIVSAYFVIILTQNLITQYHLSFTSAWINIIYALTAFAWVIFGFVKRYSFIRKFGLGLMLSTVIKLFILDLSRLTNQYRIISYFALGITLVAISFVYQYFNKRLELKLEMTDNVEKNN